MKDSGLEGMKIDLRGKINREVGDKFVEIYRKILEDRRLQRGSKQEEEKAAPAPRKTMTIVQDFCRAPAACLRTWKRIL